MRYLGTALLAALGFTAGSAAGIEVYRWVDENGVTHFSDSRPEENSQVTTLRIEERNPPDYDPAADVRAIAAAAEEENGEPTPAPDARAPADYRTPWTYTPYVVAPPSDYQFRYGPWYPWYPPVVAPPQVPDPGLPAAQQRALEAAGLTGPRPASINSRQHAERVERSRQLPVTAVEPEPPAGEQ